MARYLSLHCGDSITIGVARDSEAIHDVTQRILKATGPVRRMAISIDTSYIPIANSLHRLFLRSVDTLLDLKLRGVRVSQQLNSICAEKQRSASLTSDQIELPRLQILEVDDVSLLKHLRAPKLLTLFVDYASASESSDFGRPESDDDAQLLSPVLLRVAREILLAFLSRSGTHLERLMQADILPILFRSTPQIKSTVTVADDKYGTTMTPFVCLPSLTSLAVSDIHLLLYIQTSYLQSLTASIPNISALCFFSRYHSSQLRHLEITQPNKTALNSSHPSVMVADRDSRYLHIPHLSGASPPGERGLLRHSSSPVSTSAYDPTTCERAPNEQRTRLRCSPKASAAGAEVGRRRTRNGRAFSLPCQIGQPSLLPEFGCHKSRIWNSGTSSAAETTERCLDQTGTNGGILPDDFGNHRAATLNMFLPSLLELTVPGSLLVYLFCPSLQRVHVTGLSHRKQVLSFLQEGAPQVEELIVDNLAEMTNKQHNLQPSGTQLNANNFGETEEHELIKQRASISTTSYIRKPIPRWHLPGLKAYKGPAGLVDLDLECQRLEGLEVRLFPMLYGQR
ncbi:UNVERIFIED_CONTAM: hypothetical protein HHA_455010 [Hammondia hammondi]|eukprot:XP_008888728.1 hypothetical protein HHA_455010 [Hammondia hammondi]